MWWWAGDTAFRELRVCSLPQRSPLLLGIPLAPGTGPPPPRPVKTREQVVALFRDRTLPPSIWDLCGKAKSSVGSWALEVALKAELCGLVRLGSGLRGLGTAEQTWV